MNITSLKPVRWVRHATPEAIVASYFRGLAKAAKVDVEGFGDQSQLIGIVRDNWGWAYADQKTRTVHYWAAPLMSKRQLAHMLGHELGHLVAKRTNWTRVRAPKDELDADIYGAVAAAVLREVAP